MKIWKDAFGYEGLYQVSNNGEIRSVERYFEMFNPLTKRYNIRKIELKELKPGIDHKGYLHVGLRKNDKSTTKKIHRIVALSFLKIIEGKTQVNHIDGNKKNNDVDNLEWCNNAENQIHAIKKGLKKIYKGKDNKKSKVVYQYDFSNNLIKKWLCITDAERELEISNKNICAVCRNKRRSAGGYYWSYSIK